jgi:hypothetical protein
VRERCYQRYPKGTGSQVGGIIIINQYVAQFERVSRYLVAIVVRYKLALRQGQPT